MSTYARVRPPVLTIALIVLSVLASMPTLVSVENVLTPLLIASPGSRGFADVLHGEAWRLVTPILIHFGALHLIFNMMWLWDLGGSLERLRGFGFVALFVLATAIASNVAQYAIAGNPYFGGMSGVVYAMLGYVWMQGRLNPSFGLGLHRGTVAMMLAWYVLCWTGLLGPIANWAHTAGLVLGVAWGALGRTPAR
jgi:GlpG protein